MHSDVLGGFVAKTARTKTRLRYAESSLTFSAACHATLSCHLPKQRLAQHLIPEAFELRSLSVSQCGTQQRYPFLLASRAPLNAVQAVEAGCSPHQAIVLTRPQVRADRERRAPDTPAPSLVFAQVRPASNRLGGSYHAYPDSYLSRDPRLCPHGLRCHSPPVGLSLLKRRSADVDLLFELFITEPKVVIIIHLDAFFGRLFVGWCRNKDFFPDKLILRPSRGHCDAIFVSGLEGFHGPEVFRPYFCRLLADNRLSNERCFWDRQ